MLIITYKSIRYGTFKMRHCMPLFALSFFLSTVNSKYVFNGPNQASFCLYSSFSQYNDKYTTNTINENSVEGVLGT